MTTTTLINDLDWDIEDDGDGNLTILESRRVKIGNAFRDPALDVPDYYSDDHPIRDALDRICAKHRAEEDRMDRETEAEEHSRGYIAGQTGGAR